MLHERFTDINHQYPTRFSQNNFARRKMKLSRTKFAISSRGPRLWNNVRVRVGVRNIAFSRRIVYILCG